MSTFQKKFLKFIGNKNITANIYRIQVHDSVMYGYFCIVFIGFILNNNTQTDFTNLFRNNLKE